MISTPQYFKNVSQNDGINNIEDNPCKLLDFSKLCLRNDQVYSGNSGDREILMVILGGKCSVKVEKTIFENIGCRPNVFSGKPYAVYIPCQNEFKVNSQKNGDLEAILCCAPSNLKVEPFLITPEQVVVGKWGISNFSRHYHQILVNNIDKPVNRLIVGETYTPSGNWSTYPPHKHEVDDLPNEVYMEEIYYFKVNPSEGFGLARHYTDNESINAVYVVKDETILMMPKGYHTVVSAPGYTTYYLWMLAGNCRVQAPVNDSSVGWVAKSIPIIENIEKNLSL